MKPLLTIYRNSVLVQNTWWMFLGQGLRLIIQAAYFIIIARSLGPGQYGSFTATAALASIFSPFIGLGSDKTLIKNVAQDRRSLDECFGNGVLLTVLSGLAGTGIILGVSHFLLPATIPATVVVMVSLSDVLLYRLVDLIAAAFQSVEMMSRTAGVTVLISALRLAGIAALAGVTHQASAVSWSIVYFAASVIAAGVSLYLAGAIVVATRFCATRIKQEFCEGLCFAGGQSAQSIYNDLDKTMLARLATLDAVGIYSAAYRLIDVAFVPVRSLLFAAYPGFFRQGGRNVEATYSYARRLLLKPLLFSSCGFVALLAGAPMVPAVLGGEYARTVEALRWLSILPVLKAFHYFLADALTGAGYQGVRMIIQIAVAILNVLLNLWIIPAYSWRGASWSSLASDGALCLLMWGAVSVLRRRQSLVPAFGAATFPT